MEMVLKFRILHMEENKKRDGWGREVTIKMEADAVGEGKSGVGMSEQFYLFTLIN